MQRQRGGLVPIGDALADLGGPVKAIREDSPQARHHFTQADLTRPLRLSWPHLYRQFGADPSRASDKRTVDAFRTDCLRELKKIKTAWPELNYALGKGVLVLGPSEPSIPRNDP